MGAEEGELWADLNASPQGMAAWDYLSSGQAPLQRAWQCPQPLCSHALPLTPCPKRPAPTQEEVARLRESLAAAQAEAADLRRQLAALRAAQDSLESSLEGRQSAEDALAVQLAQARGQLSELRSGLQAATEEKAGLQHGLRAAEDKARAGATWDRARRAFKTVAWALIWLNHTLVRHAFWHPYKRTECCTLRLHHTRASPSRSSSLRWRPRRQPPHWRQHGRSWRQSRRAGR